MLASSLKNTRRLTNLVRTQARFMASDQDHTHNKTELFHYHKDKLGAKMVEFAGYDMSVLYDGEHGGVKKEHLFTRKSCGIFDVSHMGQVHFRGKDAARFLERITVVDTQALKPGQASLSLLMNEMGGIKDDCIITKVTDDHFYVVLNAGCKFKDMQHVRVHLNKKKFPDCTMQYISEETQSLIAVQGPKAQHVMSQVLDDSPDLSNLGFMESTQDLMFKHDEIIVSRCGYTGEDGFEVSIPNRQVTAFMDRLLDVQDGEGN